MPAVTPLMVNTKADPMEEPKGPASPRIEQTGKSTAFATPDRDPASDNPIAQANRGQEIATNVGKDSEAAAGKHNTVTPPESGSRDDTIKLEAESAPRSLSTNKQVRFDSDEPSKNHPPENDGADGRTSPLGNADSPASSTGSGGSKRGLVSRRGGRYGSPHRGLPAPGNGAALEYKTYRSPSGKSKGDTVTDNDVPSLSSSNSGVVQNSGSPSNGNRKGPLGIAGNAIGAEKATPEEKVAVKEETVGEPQTVSVSSLQTVPQSGGAPSVAVAGAEKKGKPASITCDTSMIASTSPLASHDVDGSPSAMARKQGASAAASTPKGARSKSEGEPENFRGSRNVTFSPPQQPHDTALDKPRKTPTKSPGGGQFQSLPTLHDAKLQSPVGIFLSPYSPSPSQYQTITEVPSFDRQGGSTKPGEEAAGGGPPRPFPDEKSSKARDQERERAVSTPTDFALDFGKNHELSASFDASNVLAWLQSPTAHGLFSPGGGLGSTATTPRGRFAAPRTPRTPTVGTSFFFSDVASLPRNGEFASPKAQGAGDAAGGPKRGGSGVQQGPLSSMICISPLASKRSNHGGNAQQGGAEGGSDTPMRYKDVFASPRLPMPRGGDGKPRNLPMLGESPTKGSKNRGRSSNLDAVHMAERDLMEDEDLSVLLQLASHSNTPGQGGASGPQVFRSPRSRTKGQVEQQRRGYGNAGQASGGALPGLQLPIIGGQGGEGTKAKLARKTAFREPADANDFTPPPLGIRSSSSGGSKEIYLGKAEGGKAAGAKNEGSGASARTSKSEKSARTGDAAKREKASSSKGKKAKKAAPAGSANATAQYQMPGTQMPYPHPGADPNVQYYPIPGTMPALPPGGNMRVVVGGPPPNGRTPASPHADKYTNSPHRPPPYAMQPGHQNGAPVPPPPPGTYPRHPYPHPPPPHMAGMAVHPPYGHYPPHPHHMPMYATQHPQGAVKTTSKKQKQSKAPKAASKRAGDGKASTPVGKKQRKSPSKSAKRKHKSAGMAEPVDRQKAAATINAVNQASGGKNDRAAALAAAILRGVTMRPSGKWQAQLYYAGKSRYIGVFDTREKAALAYEIAREKLKSDNKSPADQSAQSLKATEAAVNSARKAAFEGVNEKDPRLSSK